MLKQPSFSDILMSLNGTENLEKTTLSAGWESHLDPHGMIELITTVQPSRFRFSSKRYYPSKKNNHPLLPPPHSFNDSQRSAYDYLKTFKKNLSESFSFSELKSAYRAAVLQTHPDRGGSSESFQQVKKSYQILSALVKN